MSRRELAELLLLASLWGAAFVFMRIAAPAFGPVALAFGRVAGAALLLLPLAAHAGQLGKLRRHAWPALLVGVTNSAAPFALFSLAALSLNAGLSAIFNATTPLWAAIIASLWLGQRLGARRWLGLLVGFAGVVWLALDEASVVPGEHGVSPALAIGACLLAAALYGFSASFARRHLTGPEAPAPLAVAAGSQLGATLALAGPAWWLWPETLPPAPVWAALAALSVACTALAYLLYFRLIAHAGPTNASAVTYLIPVFAVSWGALFLGEALAPQSLVACGVILLGTALATGLWRARGA